MENLFQKILQKLQELEAELRTVRCYIAKDKIFDRWVAEDEAAAIINLNARTFRRKVTSGKIPINFRNSNGRKYQYHRGDLVAYMKATSTEI